jgi:DNA-binding transcriptional regulator YhcF (GntR family)
VLLIPAFIPGMRVASGKIRVNANIRKSDYRILRVSGFVHSQKSLQGRLEGTIIVNIH